MIKTQSIFNLLDDWDVTDDRSLARFSVDSREGRSGSAFGFGVFEERLRFRERSSATAGAAEDPKSRGGGNGLTGVPLVWEFAGSKSATEGGSSWST